jgi:hypothetical protein
MTTQHLAMRDAIVDLLKQEPPLADGRVYGGRKRPLPASASSAIVVRLERTASTLASVQGGRTSWATLISIECYGRIEGAGDSVADQLLEDIFARLETDSNLGGKAMDTEPLAGDTISWDYDELDTSLECATARFLVRHQTTGRTLTL